MKTLKRFAVAGALLAGIATMSAQSASAAGGDTSREYGCAAHWRVTANWNECINPPGVTLQLQADCKWTIDYMGPFKYVNSSTDPVDEFECFHQTYGARNAFRF